MPDFRCACCGATAEERRPECVSIERDCYRQALHDIRGIIMCESATMKEAQEHPLWLIADGALKETGR